MMTTQAIPGFPSPPTAGVAAAPAAAAPAAVVLQPTPPTPAVSNLDDLAQSIAGQTGGGDKLASLPEGLHVVEIVTTECPQLSTAIFARIKAVESPSAMVGQTYKFYQDLAGGRKPGTSEAQQRSMLNFVLSSSGFADTDAFLAAGGDAAGLAAHIRSCFVSPGPLVGRRVVCNAIGKDGVNKQGQPCRHINESFSVYRGEG